MAQVKLSYNKLINMAKQYGVEKNALFIAAANQYVLQQQVLERIKESLDEEDECTERVCERTSGMMPLSLLEMRFLSQIIIA